MSDIDDMPLITRALLLQLLEHTTLQNNLNNIIIEYTQLLQPPHVYAIICVIDGSHFYNDSVWNNRENALAVFSKLVNTNDYTRIYINRFPMNEADLLWYDDESVVIEWDAQ
jgi:hypothetical protein